MQPIFSSNPDYEKTAFVNWRMSPHSDILNLINIADGFMQSAIALAQQCIDNNSRKQADILIFPILANANHGIELYLKGIVWILNDILQTSQKVQGNHNIQQLYSTAVARIQSYEGGLPSKDFRTETTNLKAYIDELFDKLGFTDRNDKMDFSRYPFSKDYAHHFYVTAVGNVCVDLENFVARFIAIHSSLGRLADYLYHWELQKAER
jgi:hypothetical protein